MHANVVNHKHHVCINKAQFSSASSHEYDSCLDFVRQGCGRNPRPLIWCSIKRFLARTAGNRSFLHSAIIRHQLVHYSPACGVLVKNLHRWEEMFNPPEIVCLNLRVGSCGASIFVFVDARHEDFSSKESPGISRQASDDSTATGKGIRTVRSPNHGQYAPFVKKQPRPHCLP